MDSLPLTVQTKYQPAARGKATLATFARSLTRTFRPEEVLTAPFLIALAALCLQYSSHFNFNPSFLISLALVSLFYVAAIAFINLLRKLSKNTAFQDCPSAPLAREGAAAALRDWLSVAFIILVYEVLHHLVPYINPNDAGPLLLSIDRAIVGSPHPTLWLEKLVSPAMTDWMSFAYMTFFFYLPILRCVFDFKQQTNEWRILLLAFTITAIVGFLGYLLVPASGPFLTLAHAYTVDLNGNQVAAFTHELVRDLAVDKGVFPSLHIAFSSLYLFISWKYARACFWVFLPFIVSLWVSTLYLRYHYVIDIFAGYILAIAALYASEYICRKWYGERSAGAVPA
jgi:membrane-associated phospholipid phosphatase